MIALLLWLQYKIRFQIFDVWRINYKTIVQIKIIGRKHKTKIINSKKIKYNCFAIDWVKILQKVLKQKNLTH